MTGREPDPAEELLARFNEAISGVELDDLRRLAGQLLTEGTARLQGEPGPSRRRPRRDDPVRYRVRVDLVDARPPIWRCLELRSDLGLDALHQILQAAFGWSDSHLHRFALGDGVFDRTAELFLCPFDVEEGEDDGVPAADVRLDETLTEPEDVLRYCYDYGDCWELTLELQAVLPDDDQAPPAVCVAGLRASPPEDCGGLRDAAELAEVLEDPAHFDLDEVNQALRNPFVELAEAGLDPRVDRMLLGLRGTSAGDDLLARVWALVQRPPASSTGRRAAALHAFTWFLDRVGDGGLPLTAAGYLKPVDVTAAALVVPGGAEWIGAKNREIDTYPVLAFRESLQQLGLVRKYRGRLLLTKSGAAARTSPERLWRHLAERLPVGRARDMDVPAGLMALVHVASAPGEPVPYDRVGDALTCLGWREDGRLPISGRSAQHAARGTLDVLSRVTVGPSSILGPRQISEVAAELAASALLGSRP